MSHIDDIDAAHTLAIATDQARIMLDCGHLAEPDLTLVPNWRDLADTPGMGAAGASGYATDPDTDRTMCYAEANALEVARMRTADSFVAYLSADNRSVTTWPGGRLGTVTSVHTSTLARKTYVQVTDVHGAHWHGVGPAESGTYVRLRRTKTR